MGGKQTAEWWREYRRKNSDRLRAYNRARRRQPRVRGQRHEQEARRRERRRAEVAEPDQPTHSLIEEVEPLLPPKRSGRLYKFYEEVDREDALQEAVLARLEGRNPVDAIKRVYGLSKLWRKMMRVLDESYTALEDEHETEG